MSDAELSRTTRAFYERFQFPGSRPIDQDGLVFLRRFGRSVEQRLARLGDGTLRVLDAGCGTGNTSVSLARQFPRVLFHGVDQSRASLAKAKRLAASAGLENTQFRRGDLLEALPWPGPFDVIVCLGVLHHTADMRRALENLRSALADDGELFVWIYGKHGRYRHALNMRLLRMLLGKRSPPAVALELATQFAIHAGDGALLRDLIGRTNMDERQRRALVDPVWIADQFLNPREVLIDMEGLLDLAHVCGLELEHVVGMNATPSELCDCAPLRERFERLSPKEQLIAQDLLLKPERYFVVLRKAAPSARA